MAPANRFGVLCLALLVLFSGASAHAADDAKARREAAIAYEKTVPVAKMMNDMMAELEKNPQLGLTKEETEIMKTGLNEAAPALREKMLDAMVMQFTLPEIEALTNFYSSPEGSSIIKKMPKYMGEFMPFIQQQMGQILQKVLEARAAKQPSAAKP